MRKTSDLGVVRQADCHSLNPPQAQENDGCLKPTRRRLAGVERCKFQ
jgi:hypothetical protein